MTGFSVASNQTLVRSNVWSRMLKRILEDELMGMRFVKMITDFPDGTTYNIPSLGQAEVTDYDEGMAVQYTTMDQGNFTFTVGKYKVSATYITEKMRQDSYYAAQLEAAFLPSQHRALMVSLEADILETIPDGQTASNANEINGADHRWIGSGTNETISPIDFQKARYTLHKANVPLTNLVAIVDPSVEYSLATSTNLVNISNNPRWEGVVRDGLSTGTRFLFNIYGFDVYVSNYLKTVGAETINGVTSGSGAVANVLFSAAGGDANPIVGLVKQSPTVYSEFNKDLQREEYMTICRYDFGLYRPENAITIITDTDQVA